jgi:hypothetical protein
LVLSLIVTPFSEPLTEGKPEWRNKNPISQKEMGFCFAAVKSLEIAKFGVEAWDCKE